MADETVAPYPSAVAFSFLVVVPGVNGTHEGSFQEVSGLKASIEFELIKEGGENGFTRRFPKPPTYQNLVLKRGVLVGSPLIKWAMDALRDFSFEPKNIDLQLLDENANPIMTWSFVNAYPVGISVGEFNAMENKILVETLELAFDSFKLN